MSISNKPLDHYLCLSQFWLVGRDQEAPVNFDRYTEIHQNVFQFWASFMSYAGNFAPPPEMDEYDILVKPLKIPLAEIVSMDRTCFGWRDHAISYRYFNCPEPGFSFRIRSNGVFRYSMRPPTMYSYSDDTVSCISVGDTSACFEPGEVAILSSGAICTWKDTASTRSVVPL